MDPSYIFATTNTSVSLLTPKNLTKGIYPIQVCSAYPYYNCSTTCTQVCSTPAPTIFPSNCTNCTTPSPNCTQVCTPYCVLLNITTACITIAQYTVYDIPPILLSVSPSTVTTRSNVSLFGQNFAQCGSSMVVRIQSPNSIQDIPAWFNTSTQILFTANSRTQSGIITLSMDGQHFDSLSASQIMIDVTDDSSSSDNMSSDSGADHTAHGSNLTWLYVVLGVVALAAGVFLVYLIYRFKTKDDYSRLYDI